MHKKTFAVISLLSVALALVVQGNTDFPCFYNAANAVLHGQSPYGTVFYNPIWTAVLFIPYTVFPLVIATKIHIIVSMTLYSLVVLKLAKGRKNSYLYALSGIFIVITSAIGNIEYIVLLGLILPPEIGIWLVLTKPQMGILVAGVMFLEMWKSRGIKYAILVCVPVGVLGVVSLAMGMLSATPVNSWWNLSLMPYGLLLGVPLAVVAIYKKSRISALGASVCCSPYVMVAGYVAFVFLVAELYIYLSKRAAPSVDQTIVFDMTRTKNVPILRTVE